MFYHITNSSVVTPGPNGIDNIWTEDYSASSDFASGIRCRGAWDTLLKEEWDAQDQTACENSEACFPDGRYLIDISSTSQTGSTLPISLPVDDVYFPNPEPIGIVVDNFIPYVEQLVFYTTYPDGEFHLLYSNQWDTISSTERESLSRPAGYLPEGVGKTPQGYLGMAIHFSEPMDEEEMPAVWVEGLWPEEVQWSSMDHRLHWFHPSEQDPNIPSEYLSPSPQNDEKGHWMFYKSSGYSDPGYVGLLRITIGNNNMIPNTGLGLDLAGNPLDVNPETVDPVISILQMPPTLDIALVNTDSYEYGTPPEYSEIPFSDEYLWGSTGLRDFTVQIDPDLQDVIYFTGYRADCPWNHGFWTFGLDYDPPVWDGYFWFHASIVEPDNSYQRSIIQSVYPANNDENVAIIFSPVQDVYMNDTGDYLWYIVTTQDLDLDPSTPYASESWFHLYCISREATCVLFEIIYNGYGYHYDGIEEFVTNREPQRGNFPGIINVEFQDSFTLRVDFWVPTGPSPGPPVNGYYDYKIYSVPDPNSTQYLRDVAPNDSSHSSNSLVEEQHVLQMALNTNPVSGSSLLNYSVPVAGHVCIQIYDLAGRSVQTLLNGEVAAGNHSVSWNTDNIASGVYFVRLTTTEGTVSSQAMVLR
jgi:hypothetical protein